MGACLNRFQQADASTHSEYGGTGLGLVNVKHYAQIMGGDVTLESVFGEGTTFTLWLPIQAQVAKLEVEETDPPPAPEGALTVLVIDDDPQCRETMGRVLEEEGFYVVTAGSGEQGLRLAKQFRPAVITLDVLMPSMDGWSVLTQLKMDMELADIPVVMVTQVEGRNMASNLGAADFLTKPVNRERLIHTLNRYLSNETGVSILVVDDEVSIRSAFRDILEKEGWNVSTAENGREALERVNESLPSLILLDLMMPEMNGFAFIEELRKNPAWRMIPVIIVTAKEITEEDRLRLNGYVEKVLAKADIKQDELSQVIRRSVEQCGLLVCEGGEVE